MKVLIVEDEEIIRKKLEILPSFSKYGMEVLESAKNGLEGLEKIKRFNPELVITDISMPLMDGLTMIKESLDYEYSAIIVSGYNDFDYAKKAIKYGVTDYLLKPIDIEELNKSLITAKNIYEMRKSFINQEDNIDILKIEKNENKKSDIALEMIAYIEKNYGEKISISDLEKKLNYSESMLNKKFKEYTSITFNDYLNRVRIKEAIKLLENTELMIIDIAFLCGFSNQKYFSKVFKKFVGISPGKYNKNI
ncbi:response regulator [Anaerococcus sp. WCA-380-WT-2B]|uniref:Response regulator n=1 Tax=Anaerococcus porci TaxID=2652269 RepID=A0A6N7VTW4_9FIRM|nr:helix-turn-helix domain-containing protein [Anaerococcus porci]MSS77494.1 response regulator [Anaerococcus porci]